MGSPRQDGICQELINQVRKYFLDCEIKLYDSYKLAPSPCTDCKWCEYHDGCSNKDLDIFFEDFEDADYIAFFTPVYNNFFPAPIKAILDRFQRYYNARYKRGANPPIKSQKELVLLSQAALMQGSRQIICIIRLSSHLHHLAVRFAPGIISLIPIWADILLI